MGSAVLERYGMTETLMNVSNPYEGSAGRAPSGSRCPVSRSGCPRQDEILVRGPNVFGGYWERPAADAEVFVAGG